MLTFQPHAVYCPQRFFSSQALGGHQNAHKRERVAARQSSSHVTVEVPPRRFFRALNRELLPPPSSLPRANPSSSTSPDSGLRFWWMTINYLAIISHPPSLSLQRQIHFRDRYFFPGNIKISDSQKPTHEDVFMEEDEAPKAPEEKKDEPGGWTKVANSGIAEQSKTEDKEEVVPVESIHEAPVGKGLAGALQMLKERGSLKETINWGGRNMDKKKSKLVGIYDDEGPKEIHLERIDEYGRIVSDLQT